MINYGSNLIYEYVCKFKDTDYEEQSSAFIRYKPRPIEELVKATRFTKKEIQFMYRGFKQECPSGIVNEQMFKEIYSQFFPQGGNLFSFTFSTLRLIIYTMKKNIYIFL